MDEGAHQRSASGQAHWLTNDTPKETPLGLVREGEDHDDVDENLGELQENSPQSSVLRRQQEDELKILASQGEDIFMMHNTVDSLEGRRDSTATDNEGKEVFCHSDSNNEFRHDADTRRSGRMYDVYDEGNDGYAYNLNYKRRSGDENNNSRTVYAAGSQVQRANRDTSYRQTPTSVTQSKARSSSLRGAYYALIQQPLSKASVPANHNDQNQSGYASTLSSARSNATPTSSYASQRYAPAPAPSPSATTRSYASEKAMADRGRPYSTPHRPLSPANARVATGPRASYSHPLSMRGGNSPVSTHHLPRRQSPSTRNKRSVMGLMRGIDTVVAVTPQHRARAGHTTVTTRSDPTNFSNRLQALMVVRDRMEHLAATHRQEEAALREMLQDLFHKEDAADAIDSNRSGHEFTAIPPRPNPPRELLEANSLLKKQLDEYSKKCEDIDSKLRDAVSERDKAINLLEKFQEEGSRVIESLHSSVKKANQENVKMLQQSESLMQENARLKEIIKRLSRQKTQTRGDLEMKANDLVSGTAEPGDEKQEVVGENHISIDFHEEVVQDYQALLGEADDVITSLRTVNEDLKRDVANLTARVESYAGNDSKENSDNTDNEPRTQKMENLIHELRAEKLQRLQAEEHAHELSVQHQKHTSLLEQRILHLTKLLYGGRGDRGSSSSASSSSVASFSYRGHLNSFTPSSPLPLRAGAPDEIASERSPSSQRHPLVAGLSLSGVHTAPSTCGVGSALQTSRTDQNDLFSPSPGRTPRQEVNWSFVYEKRANHRSSNNSGRQCAVASPRGRDEVHTPLTIGEVSTVTSTQFSVVQCPSEKGHLYSHTTGDAISPVDPSHSGHTSPVSVAGAGSDEAFHQLSPFQLRRLHRDQALARKAYLAPDTSPAAQTVPRLSSTSSTLKESTELSDPDVCEYSDAIQSESQLLRLAEVDDGDQSFKQSLSPPPEQRLEEAALTETTNYSSVGDKSSNSFGIAKADVCGNTDTSTPRDREHGDDALGNEPEEVLVSEADEISADLF